jgi:hypothetical protein
MCSLLWTRPHVHWRSCSRLHFPVRVVQKRTATSGNDMRLSQLWTYTIVVLTLASADVLHGQASCVDLAHGLFDVTAGSSQYDASYQRVESLRSRNVTSIGQAEQDGINGILPIGGILASIGLTHDQAGYTQMLNMSETDLSTAFSTHSVDAFFTQTFSNNAAATVQACLRQPGLHVWTSYNASNPDVLAINLTFVAYNGAPSGGAPVEVRSSNPVITCAEKKFKLVAAQTKSVSCSRDPSDKLGGLITVNTTVLLPELGNVWMNAKQPPPSPIQHLYLSPYRLVDPNARNEVGTTGDLPATLTVVGAWRAGIGFPCVQTSGDPNGQRSGAFVYYSAVVELWPEGAVVASSTAQYTGPIIIQPHTRAILYMVDSDVPGGTDNSVCSDNPMRYSFAENAP